MPTSVGVKDFKINKLTRAQYDTAVAQGIISATDLSFITDEVYPTMSAPSVAPVLTTGGWTNNEQTVNVTGVTASNFVIVGPDPASCSEYALANVLCTGQGAGTLTFTCETTPSNNITLNVLIFS